MEGGIGWSTPFHLDFPNSLIINLLQIKRWKATKNWQRFCSALAVLKTGNMLWILLFLYLTSFQGMSSLAPDNKGHRISNVETNGSWVYMYNQNGKRYKTMSSSSVGEVKGFSATFFVSQNGSWIYLWDSEGKRYKTMSYSSVGDVVGVSGETFTSRSGSWIYTWSKDGKKINTRSAR